MPPTTTFGNRQRKETNFFSRLGRIFRSGPAIRRLVKNQEFRPDLIQQQAPNNINGFFGGKQSYQTMGMLGAYGVLNREVRYQEFAEMEYQSEISTALDLYADEACSGDQNGRCFHIFSDNPDIQRALEELFYDVCNVDFELRRWIRNLVKFGDTLLHVEVQPDYGVTAVQNIKVNEIEREENFDPQDPYAVRFKIMYGAGNKYLENWQVIHFRIVSNDIFLPYGTSFLETARKVWRQLVMMEDAMLVYRIVRSPERRVFYIDTTGIDPNTIPTYLEQVKQAMRSRESVDRMTGRIDERFNPPDPLEDYFLPTKLNSQTKIETLAGGQHVSAVEDVEYFNKKLTAALKVPRAYLNYEDGLGSKATLSQEDIRFSRTITNLQKIIIAELNQLAVLHLFAKGFEGEDLQDFELKLSNPSTTALMQKLNLWSQKFDLADKAKSTELVSEEWIKKEILELRADVIIKNDLQIEKEVLRKKVLEELQPPKNSSGNSQMDSFVDPFDPSNYQVPVSPKTGGGAKTTGVSPNGNQTTTTNQADNSLMTGSSSAVGNYKILPISPNTNVTRNSNKNNESPGLRSKNVFDVDDFNDLISNNQQNNNLDIKWMLFGSEKQNNKVKFQAESFVHEEVKSGNGWIEHIPLHLRNKLIKMKESWKKVNNGMIKDSVEVNNNDSTELILEVDDSVEQETSEELFERNLAKILEMDF
jgi:hypothetical protein